MKYCCGLFRLRPATLFGAFFLCAPVHSETLRVFADITLVDAFREISREYEATSPDSDVEFNFADSARLQRQIEQGAPADILAVDDIAHIQSLDLLGLISTHTVFAQNQIVAVVAKDSTLHEPKSLVRIGLKIAVLEKGSPAGSLMERLLERMQRAGVYGSDYRSWIKANIAHRGIDGRKIIDAVARGEAGAGFVYATDVRGSTTNVRVMTIPDRHNIRMVYSIAILDKGSKSTARRFISYVVSPKGSNILQKRGFLPKPGA